MKADSDAILSSRPPRAGPLIPVHALENDWRWLYVSFHAGCRPRTVGSGVGAGVGSGVGSGVGVGVGFSVVVDLHVAGRSAGEGTPEKTTE